MIGTRIKKIIFIVLLTLYCQLVQADGQQYLLEASEHIKKYLTIRNSLVKSEGVTKRFIGGIYKKVKYVSYAMTTGKDEHNMEDQFYDYYSGELIHKRVSIYGESYETTLYVVFLNKNDEIIYFEKYLPLQKILKKPSVIEFVSKTYYFDNNGNPKYPKYLYMRKTVVDYSTATAIFNDYEISATQEVLSYKKGEANFDEYVSDEKLLK